MTLQSQCFKDIAFLGIEKYASPSSRYSKIRQIPKLLNEIDLQTPDIDRYAQNFLNSNNQWPNIANVKKYLRKRIDKMEEAFLKLTKFSDYRTSRQLQNIIQHLRNAKENLDKRVFNFSDLRPYKIGDNEIKFQLNHFDHRFRGELGEIKSWYRTQNPIELNFLLRSSQRSKNPELSHFQDRLEQFRIKVSKMNRKEILKLKKNLQTHQYLRKILVSRQCAEECLNY